MSALDRARPDVMGSQPAMPTLRLKRVGEVEIADSAPGLTKREYIAALMLHAEFLSSSALEAPAQALIEAAAEAGQSIEQRMAVNALRVTDALLSELSK